MQSADIVTASRILSLIPQAEANGTFDYSGFVPDGMLQHYIPIVIEPTPTPVIANSAQTVQLTG